MFDPPVPLAFHPDMEKEEAGEAETAKALLETMHGIGARTCGLAAHKPLGSVLCVRKAACEMSARSRGEPNGRAIAEPTSAPLPG